MEIPATFNLLLGRPWLHSLGAVPSTLHQKIKVVYKGELLTIYGDTSIHPHPETKDGMPALEVAPHTEDTFLTGFRVEEAAVVQALMAERDMYMSIPAIKMMSKQNYFPGLGLGKDSQGVAEMVEFPHNAYDFGLGYVPMPAEIEGKRREIMKKAKAIKEGKKWPEKKLVIPNTLNGMFVREGEDLPFCGFSETWVDNKGCVQPGMQILFDVPFEEMVGNDDSSVVAVVRDWVENLDWDLGSPFEESERSVELAKEVVDKT